MSKSILKSCFPLQETETFKQASERITPALTPEQILDDLDTVSITFPETRMESSTMEGDVWEHLDPALKVGCFIFPFISLTIRNIWNVLFAGQQSKSNRQSSMGKNLFFLWLGSLKFCGPHFQAHHFLSRVTKVNGHFCAPALLLLFWVVLSEPLSFTLLMTILLLSSSVSWNVSLNLIIASCSVRITAYSVFLLMRYLIFP